MKMKNRSRKQTLELDGIGVARIDQNVFKLTSFCIYNRSLNVKSLANGFNNNVMIGAFLLCLMASPFVYTSRFFHKFFLRKTASLEKD